jgi:hypothetical protein
MFLLGYLTCCTKCGGCLKNETRRCLRKIIQEHKVTAITIKTPVAKCAMHEECTLRIEEGWGGGEKHVWIFTLSELQADAEDNS